MATSSQGYGQAVPEDPAAVGDVGRAATGGSLADRNCALVRRFFEEGVNGPDQGLIASLLSPDFTIAHNVRAATRSGPEAFQEVCGGFFTAFPDLQVTVQDVFGAGDRVAAELLVGGTNSGEWLGHPASGKRVTYQAINLVTVENDRITHMAIIDDYCSILQQLGLIVIPEVSRH